MAEQKLALTVSVLLEHVDGPRQDPDSVVDALSEQLDGLGEIYAQDAEHEEEGEYRLAQFVILPATDDEASR